MFESALGTVTLDIVEQAIPMLIQLRNSPNQKLQVHLKISNNIKNNIFHKLQADLQVLLPGNIDFSQPNAMEHALEQLQNMADLLRMQECEGTAVQTDEMR